MKEKQKKIKKISSSAFISNVFVSKWLSIFLAYLFGYLINGGAIYIFDSDLFSDLLIFEHFIAFLIILFLLSLMFAIVLVKVKFEVNAVWARILFCLITPLIINFLFVIFTGNDTVSGLIYKMSADMEELIYTSVSVISIISGQLFIKPWRSLLNFVLGTLYVALMCTVLILYTLLLVGIIYGNWL